MELMKNLLCKSGFHKWSEWYSLSRFQKIYRIRHCLRCHTREYVEVKTIAPERDWELERQAMLSKKLP